MNSALYTIGFTQKSAETFFGLIMREGVKSVLDIRLGVSSQLSGFAKQPDLEYFLRAICDVRYKYVPELAPTRELLDAYKKQKGSWSLYEAGFLRLLQQREVEKRLDSTLFEDSCLLCSEHKADFCHRRLVAEYLSNAWGSGISIKHL